MLAEDPRSSLPTESPPQPRGLFAEWVVLALLFGTVLFVLHAVVVLAAHGLDTQDARELAAWHIGLTLERLFPFALLTAAVASAIALALSPRVWPPVLVCSVLFVAAISGWPLEDARHVPDPTRMHGRIALLECALAALLLASLLVFLCRRARLRADLGGLCSKPWALVLVLAFAALAPGTAWALCRRSPPMRAVRERVGELLVGPASWTVVRSNPKAPPHAGYLTPSLIGWVDGGDMYSLIMPPPCEVRFEIPRDVGRVNLRASAGVDRRFRWQLEHTPEDTSVRFEIAVDGKPRFLAVLPAHGPDWARTWHHAGGRDGLALEAGDVVTLRTSISPPDATIAGVLGLLAGFGRLELERTLLRPRERASASKPNVVLIVMDTLRCDELSCYGHAGRVSPELDALAARGVLYEKACATSSWTWPSTTSVLTGLEPQAHGVVDDSACYLDDGLQTLAEGLEASGYTTAAFVCTGILDPVKNFDQGFESYDYARDMRKSDLVLPDVAAWLDEYADARFFLYLHLVDTHEPVEPRAQDLARVGVSGSPPPGCPDRPASVYREALINSEGLTAEGKSNADLVVPMEHQRWIRETYSAAVSTADHQVGVVLDLLAKLGLDEKTVVAFTSDHGEELFDHGFLGHDHSLHQELVRVPLILAGPGIPRGVRVGTPVSNAHLAWTLARCGGGDLATAAERIDLRAPERVERRPIYFSTEHGWWWNVNRIRIAGLMDWPWVLHAVPLGLPWGVPRTTDPGEGELRLFNLEEDPGERVDLSKAEAERARTMHRALLEHMDTTFASRVGRGRSAGDATREFLRRFGYLGEDEEPKKPR